MEKDSRRRFEKISFTIAVIIAIPFALLTYSNNPYIELIGYGLMTIVNVFVLVAMIISVIQDKKDKLTEDSQIY